MTESFHQHMPAKDGTGQDTNSLPVDPDSIGTEQSSLSMSKMIGTFLVVIVAGLFTGFVLAKFHKPVTTSQTSGTMTSTQTSGKIVGMKDKSTFKDSAEGILKEGGIEGEGNFHLERPGGESQNVYLTSATVDLSGYIGKKVKVWGQTINSQKAGWLMDVGLVEGE